MLGAKSVMHEQELNKRMRCVDPGAAAEARRAATRKYHHLTGQKERRKRQPFVDGPLLGMCASGWVSRYG